MPNNKRLSGFVNALIICVILSCSFATPAYAEFSVSFDNTNNANELSAKRTLESSDIAVLVTEFVNTNFKLNGPLSLIFGGDDGPLYDSDSNEIFIPYAFFMESEDRFKATKYESDTGVSPEEATIDSILHTIFHELAHALIAMHQIPIAGKEEDAADNLATILLIDHFQEGQEIAISAADLFDLESLDIEEFEEQDFTDEHSLDAQRFYHTLCLIYGSDPIAYQYISEDANYDDQQREMCKQNYHNISTSWNTLLKSIIISY